MDGSQQARAHNESPDQRKAEGEDGQQNGPAFQALAFLDHNGGMQQRRRQEPGHEARVLDRIPEPETAPAQLVIGPPRPKRDANGQKHPSRQRPRPHPPAPSRIHAPLDQRRHGKAEGHAEADIAEVKKRRVEGQTGVLQERVQVLPVKGRRAHAQKGVRGEKDERQKGHPNRRLYREHPRAQARRQVAAKPRGHRPEKRHDQHPKQHRPFVIAPCAADFIKHRLGGMAVGHHQLQAEIRGNKGPHQRAKRQRNQDKLRRRRRFGHRHPARAAPPSAPHRHHHLYKRHAKGEHKREMSKLCNHGPDYRGPKPPKPWQIKREKRSIGRSQPRLRRQASRAAFSDGATAARARQLSAPVSAT